MREGRKKGKKRGREDRIKVGKWKGKEERRKLGKAKRRRGEGK